MASLSSSGLGQAEPKKCQSTTISGHVDYAEKWVKVLYDK
jgi:hypothetical protein